MIANENVIEFSLNSFQLSSSSVITLCDKMNDVFSGDRMAGSRYKQMITGLDSITPQSDPGPVSI